MFNLLRYLKHRKLKRLWDQVFPGMTIPQAEEIMGIKFSIVSENETGRLVYSNNSVDYLPFYLVVDKSTNKIMRRHNIRALDELFHGA